MRRVKVKYSSLHSSLINLPLSVYGPLVSTGVRPQTVAVHLSNSKKGDDLRTGYVGWTGLASSPSSARWKSDDGLESIEIDPQLCSSLGFSEGEVLELGLVHNLPIASSVSTEPVSSDDWEILELHAQYVEDNLLSQVRVVSKEQEVNVWIMGKTLIRFRVLSLDPEKSPQLLSTNTELIIAPKTRRKNVESTRITTKQEPTAGIARLLPSSQCLSAFSEYENPSSTVLVSPQTLRTMGFQNGQHVYLEKLLPPINGLVKDIKHLPQVQDGTTPRDIALKRLRDELPENRISNPVEDKEVPSFTIQSLETVAVNHIGLLDYPESRPWDIIRLSSTPLENTEEGKQKKINTTPMFRIPSLKTPSSLGLEESVDACVKHVESAFLARETSRSTVLTGPRILLCGGKGVGKTTAAIHVANKLEHATHLLLCPFYVDMARFNDESLAGLRSLFVMLIRLAIWHKPSFLILDNIHQLIGQETEHTESFKSTQICELFVNFLKEVSYHSVGVLAIAESVASLHKGLSTGHSFSKTLTLKPPNKDFRVKILRQIVKDFPAVAGDSPDSINYVAISTKTEGYSLQDLQDLADRALHNAAIRTAKDPEAKIHVQMSDFDSAQDGYTPLSLRDVKLQKSDVEWADIGGLHATRQVLRETLEWPTKYAAIFAKCPLRLRSGLLLYGYPGCGKTMLASAVSKECGLNFIAVKGPELLNKYIGASEQSVRELFERASAAKPCVLFFDEFDSIAPRRGHDSTGVTDRVVNQMLTQMDGAEGLDGVYVLAATSRPDLIDPALLRPGRLDKSLLCHMPTEEERVQILSAIVRKMQLEPGVDLSRMAGLTDGFSGADLQALVYNAHLESVHDILSASPSLDSRSDSQPSEFVILGKQHANQSQSKAQQAAVSARINTILKAGKKTPSNVTSKAESKAPIIRQAHLERALQSTRASVPEAERSRLEAIYREFSNDRTGAIQHPPEVNPHAVGNRASLM